MKPSKTKSIGILGGMGPAATVDLFSKMVALTPADSDQDHLHILIDNNPSIPDRTAAILGLGESPVPSLFRSAETLIRAGAELIVMPCVTAHYYYDQLTEDLAVPMLNLIDEMIHEVTARHRGVKRIGLMATTGTIKGRVFNRKTELAGLSLLCPEEKEQEMLMKAIYGPSGIKRGYLEGESKNILLQVGTSLIDSGAEMIFAACTEIPLVLKNGALPVPLVDALEVLARRSIEYALGENLQTADETVSRSLARPKNAQILVKDLPFGKATRRTIGQ
jgi:aspartate racemase